jgi:hypothetical protein
MLNPWTILGGVMVLFLTAAFSYGYGHHVDHLAFVAYQKDQAAKAAQQVAANRAALLAAQQASQEEMAKINQTHTENVDEIKKRRDALRAAVSSMSQRLYVNTAGYGGANAGMSEAGASGPSATEASYAALPAGFGNWLIDKFTEADDSAATVTALQQIVIEDRKICDGRLPGIASPQ